MSAARIRIQELVAYNEKYSEAFPGVPHMSQIQAMGRKPGASVLSIGKFRAPRMASLSK
jgi:hypothetical protein